MNLDLPLIKTINSCTIGQQQRHIAVFSFSTVKSEGKKEKANLNGNLVPSINIHRDSHHSGAMMEGNYHYLFVFIKQIQHRLVLQVGGFITGTKWVLIGNGLGRGAGLVMRQSGT